VIQPGRSTDRQNNITLKASGSDGCGVLFLAMSYHFPPMAFPVVEGNSEVTNGDVLGGKAVWSVSMAAPFVSVLRGIRRLISREVARSHCEPHPQRLQIGW